MKSVLTELKTSLTKRLRFMFSGLAVFFAVLLPGALWYKGAQRSVASTAALDATRALQQRVELAASSLGGSLELAMPWLWSQDSRPRNKALAERLRRDMPYDVVTVFDHERLFYDGYRTLSDGSGVVDLTGEAAGLLFTADTGFFDRVGVGQMISGLISVEDKPLLISATRLPLRNSGVTPGFILVGKWLKPEHLQSTQGQQIRDVRYFSFANDAMIPAGVQTIIPAAQRNDGYIYELDGDGNGKLYSLVNDIDGRPTLIAELPWQAPWRATGTLGFGIFFSTAALAGIGTWALLLWGDARSRRRTRRFDGLSSLNVEQIRTLVEAFPGYAFAIKPTLEYVGVSRILAGVTGHEPSYFLGQKFGVIAKETSDGSYDHLFADLRNPQRWPRTAEVKHFVEGLGDVYEFKGSAHFLMKQDIMLVILMSEKSLMARNKGLPTSNKAEVTSNVA